MRIVPVFEIDLAIGGEDRAVLRVDAAVGEHERQAALRLPQLRRTAAAAELVGDAEVLLLAQREVRLDRIDLRHRRQQRRGPDQIADLRRRDRGDAVDERRDAA